MKSQLSLDEFEAMCKLNVELKGVTEVIHASSSPEFEFYLGVVMPHDDIVGAYMVRLRVLKDKIAEDSEYANDYETIVNCLRSSHSSELGLTWLSSSDKIYLCFYEPTSQKMLGVLTNPDESSFVDA